MYGIVGENTQQWHGYHSAFLRNLQSKKVTNLKSNGETNMTVLHSFQTQIQALRLVGECAYADVIHTCFGIFLYIA